ncbi:MAG: hypothetical protein E7509_04060 [Ruminococcus sp.]|nr:hypothetical protein [Ruminococcus sp.]
MGFLGIFKKKTKEVSALEKRILELKNKRINCVYQDFSEFVMDMELDSSHTGKLKPVNYYALKNKYIEAHYFYSADYKECYVKFTAYENDKAFDKSRIFEISTETLLKAFSKVGIIIKLDDNTENG